MPWINAAAMRRVVGAGERTGLAFRTGPLLDDLLEGRSRPGELKEVAIEDLLGRQPITPDWKSIRGWLGGRSVLVTGAGGSIGLELCRQCAKHGARQIALLEIDELALITAEAELRRDFPQIQYVPVLGDCGDPRSEEHTSELQSLMRTSYAVFCLKKKKKSNMTTARVYSKIKERSTYNNAKI